MSQRDLKPTCPLRLASLGIALAVAGCGGQVVVDDGGTTTAGCDAPPEVDGGSMEAFAQAQCLIADRPESVLVWMLTSPTHGGRMDGTGGWRFHFVAPADPSTHLIVHISSDQVHVSNETYPPCSDPITPFDSFDITETCASLLPSGLGANTVHIRKSRCPGFEDLQGLAHASILDTEASEYFHAFFDDLDDVVASCGPCESLVPTECGCPGN